MKGVLLLFVAAVSWKVVDGQSCITVLTDIVDAELPINDTTVRREYIICPNTTIETGFIDETDPARPIIGNFPIAVRANATVKCGADGSRSNNCKLILGDVGILMTPFDGLTPLHDQEGVIVQGVTTEDILFTPLFMNLAYGKVKLVDCAFLRSRADPNILIGGVPTARRRRSLMQDDFIPTQYPGLFLPNFTKFREEHKARMDLDYSLDLEPAEDNDHRQLQGSGYPPLDVTFERCLFEGNLGVREFRSNAGATLVYTYTEDISLSFHGCTFRNNDFGPIPFPGGFIPSKALVLMSGVPAYTLPIRLTMSSNCFLNNTISNVGMVLVQDLPVTTVSFGNNYIDSVDPTWECPFASLMTAANGVVTVNQCFQASAATCMPPTLSPSSFPTPLASAEPSLAPSMTSSPSAAPVTPAPVTPAPITPAPVTPAPTTPAPVTSAPVTPAPTTPAPLSPAPVTSAPVAPVTPAPVAPVTPAPTSATPAPVNPATPQPTTSEATCLLWPASSLTALLVVATLLM